MEDINVLLVELRSASDNAEMLSPHVVRAFLTRAADALSDVPEELTVAERLRSFATGSEPVPQALRAVPYAAMATIADWLDYSEAMTQLPAEGWKPDPRDPDSSRPGIFRDHNCWKCKDGADPCVVGNPRQCEYPHARND